MCKTFIGYLSLILCVGLCSIANAAIKEYHLVIDEKKIMINGKSSKKITVNGQFPAPTLTFEEGDEAIIVVENHLKNAETALHWHGLLLPGLMDGVPGLNGFKSIRPHGQFTYRFKIRQNGSYWYHAHSKGQEQDGLYGAFIIYPKGQQPLAAYETAQQDYVVMLSDDHPSSAETIFKHLKQDSDYYQNRRETLADVWSEMHQKGMKATWQQRRMWNQMRMLKTDLSDVSGYTFLVNGQSPAQNWTAKFQAHDKIRLRFINASAMSFFDVRIPHLKMTVVSADGQAVQPVNVDEFRIGTAETYDVIVQPTENQYQIQAESIDRTGFALATLLQQGSQAIALPQPPHRPRAVLTMVDMPMSTGTAHHRHQSEPVATSVSEHSQHLPTASGQHHMHADDMTTMPMTTKPVDKATDVQQQAVSKTTLTSMQDTLSGWANAATPAGNKALQYSDLKALLPQQDTRKATQDISIELGGSMERYVWTINGKTYSQAQPLHVEYGERVRLKLINHTMMAHPMHLHGMFVQLENGQPAAYLPNKHTVVVPPNKVMTVLLTANELGEWALHCHLLYHMNAGMMSKLIIAHTLPQNNRHEAFHHIDDTLAPQGGHHEPE